MLGAPLVVPCGGLEAVFTPVSITTTYGKLIAPTSIADPRDNPRAAVGTGRLYFGRTPVNMQFFHIYKGVGDKRQPRRYRKAMIFRWWWLALLLFLLPFPVASQGDSAVVQVVRVIDGDTIQVCCIFGDRVKVWYIGVDTPETHHPMRGVEPYGKEASEANRKLVEGKTVRLDFDVQQMDRYKRLLAYVYLQDGTFVNAWLVEHGFAQVMTVPPNVKHQELFLKIQREAREGRLWRRQIFSDVMRHVAGPTI